MVNRKPVIACRFQGDLMATILLQPILELQKIFQACFKSILKLQAVAGKNSSHNELVMYIHSASYFSFSRHYALAVAIWADELTLVVNCHSRSATHLGAQEVWLLSMTGSKSRTILQPSLSISKLH